jgi:hypothetical protein
MEASSLSNNNLHTFVTVLKAILKNVEEHGDKNVPISKIKSLLDHYNI